MKRIFFFIIIATAIFYTTNSQAQIFRLGVKAGATFSKFNWSDNPIKDNTATGYQFGLMSRIKIPIIGLAINPEILYTMVGNDFGKLGYLQVPINLQWGIDLKVVRPFLQAGPYWGYALNKSSDTENFNFDNIKRNDWGIGLGAGIELLNHLQIAFKYDWGFSNLNDGSWSESFKNRVFNLSVGYLF